MKCVVPIYLEQMKFNIYVYIYIAIYLARYDSLYEI